MHYIRLMNDMCHLYRTLRMGDVGNTGSHRTRSPAVRYDTRVHDSPTKYDIKSRVHDNHRQIGFLGSCNKRRLVFV